MNEYRKKLALALYVVALLSKTIHPQPISSLSSLEYSNPVLRTLREEIKKNLIATHSSRDEFVILKFYEYTVKKKENFFLIMAKTSMDMDTLMSVNDLTSPYEIYPGTKLRIPNMRGIFYEKSCDSRSDCLQKIASEHRMDPQKIFIDPYTGKYFIPGGKIPDREKKFFLGKEFAPPLQTYRLTSHFGKRNDPFTNQETFHGGMDLAAPEGSPVYASASGIVEFAGKREGYGNLVILRHDHGYETRYGHLQNFLTSAGKVLAKGQRVQKGEQIGRVGRTGRATGFHLHFEIRRFSKPEKPIFR